MDNLTSPKTYVDKDNIPLSAKEISELREVLRISLGRYVDKLSDEDLSEIGSSMLQATAIVLKAKYSRKKSQSKD